MKNKALIVLLFHLFTILPLHSQMRINFSGDSPMRKLQIAEMAITNLYVDSVDEQKLVEDAIRGMLEKLDPHSSYADPKEVKALNEPLQGNFEGIGVQFNMVDDTLLVIQPVVKGPSEKVGIMAGDRIVTVNDTAIAGVKMAREEIMRRLRGPKGTKSKPRHSAPRRARSDEVHSQEGQNPREKHRRRVHAPPRSGLHKDRQLRRDDLRRVHGRRGAA